MTCVPAGTITGVSSTADSQKVRSTRATDGGSRVIHDAKMPNLGVGLDTANLILYGKANPVDAVDILGPHIRSIHAKDGKWPTDPSQLGEEVLIGKGLVDFRAVFTRLHKIGYTGAVTIERETSGPQQVDDVRQEKMYLEKILNEVLA